MKNFLVAIFVSILLTSCFSSNVEDVTVADINSNKVNNEDTNIEDTNVESDTIVDEIDVNKKLEEYGVSLSSCDEQTDSAMKQECINNIYLSTAVGFLDIELCSMIKGNDDLKIMCNLETIKGEAVNKKNILICDNIKSIDFTSKTTDFTKRIDIFVKECQGKLNKNGN